MNFQSGYVIKKKKIEIGYKSEIYLGVLRFIFSSGTTGHIQK